MENFIFCALAQSFNNMAELTIKNPISQQKNKFTKMFWSATLQKNEAYH